MYTPHMDLNHILTFQFSKIKRCTKKLETQVLFKQDSDLFAVFVTVCISMKIY